MKGCLLAGFAGALYALSWFAGVVAGIAFLAVVGVFVVTVAWATAGTVRRRDLHAARMRGLRKPLPTLLTDERARAMNAELGWPANSGHPEDLPGASNEALHHYFTGKHDAAEMERLLDERCGLGEYARPGGS